MKTGTFKRTLRAVVPITCSECGYPRGMKTETGKITCSRCGEVQ